MLPFTVTALHGCSLVARWLQYVVRRYPHFQYPLASIDWQCLKWASVEALLHFALWCPMTSSYTPALLRSSQYSIMPSLCSILWAIHNGPR